MIIIKMCPSKISMPSLRKLVQLCFEIICFCFTFVVIYGQIELYMKNEDSSSFKIKNYADEPVNQYPDVSICFTNSEKATRNKTRRFPFDSSIWNKEAFVKLTRGPNFHDVINTSREGSANKGAESISNSWIMDVFGSSWVI